MKNKTLLNGILIPEIGFGTWLIPNSKAAETVEMALKVGYRLIDTAEAYENEQGVGEGVRNSGLKREEIFVTTKLRAEYKTYDSAKKAIEESLAKLNIGYIDLMIIHSPQPWLQYRNGEHYFEGNLEAWKALEEYYKLGKIKAIGISNFEKEDVDNLLQHGEIPPMVNQILAHLGNLPMDLVSYCQQNGLVVEAHSPFGHGEVLKDHTIEALAEKYHVSTASLCIQYLLDKNILPLPKSMNEEHMKANLETDFSILPEDQKVLDAFHLKNYGHSSIWPVYGKR